LAALASRFFKPELLRPVLRWVSRRVWRRCCSQTTTTRVCPTAGDRRWPEGPRRWWLPDNEEKTELEVDASSEVKITLLRKLLKTQGEIVWLGSRDSNSSKRVS